MAVPVTHFVRRRVWATGLTFLAAVGLAAVLATRSASLRDTARSSGWLLLGMVLLLACYNLRKKLPYPPLLDSSIWLQIHVYLGMLSVAVFLMHVGFRLPNGPLEMVLAILFTAISLSGIIGAALTRIIPPRLAVRGQEVLFERIPAFRKQLREEAEALVIHCAESARSTTLGDFYRHRAAAFFDRPRFFWHHLFQSKQPLHNLTKEFSSLDRYFNEEERRAADRLGELIEAKDALDYHWAMQGLLKGWLFVHIPLSFGLLIFVALHLFLVYAFSA